WSGSAAASMSPCRWAALISVRSRPSSAVMVSDSARRAPGRAGLLLVEALADDWGVRRHGVGKAVWFELGPVQDGAEYGGRTDAA
ncbi:ATP-binding protein, partial [Streptomyces albidoflavus]|uniref:ATP-binding protein n=1 Tax=Streptomyces albidoflavus TaxID=1886 RepID=UPI00211BCC32